MKINQDIIDFVEFNPDVKVKDIEEKFGISHGSAVKYRKQILQDRAEREITQAEKILNDRQLLTTERQNAIYSQIEPVILSHFFWFPDVFLMANSKITANYFTHKICKEVYKVILNSINTIGLMPTEETTLNQMRESRITLNAEDNLDLDIIFNSPMTWDRETFVQQLKDFIARYTSRDFCSYIFEALTGRGGVDEDGKYKSAREFRVKTVESFAEKVLSDIHFESVTLNETLADDPFKECEEPKRIDLFLPQLNKEINGLPEGVNMVIAPSGTGKTTFAVNQALFSAKQGKRVLFISLADQNKAEICTRMLANLISSSNPKKPKRYRELLNLPTDTKNKLVKDNHFVDIFKNITVDVEHNVSVTEIINKINTYYKTCKFSEKFDLVIIDYDGVIKSSNPKRQLWEQADHIYDSLSRWGKETHTVVLSFSQHGSAENDDNGLIGEDGSAGGKSKARHCARVLSINKTNDIQLPEYHTSVQKIYSCKAREGGVTWVAVNYHGDLQIIEEKEIS